MPVINEENRQQVPINKGKKVAIITQNIAKIGSDKSENIREIIPLKR